MINMKEVCTHPERFVLELKSGRVLKLANKFILQMAGDGDTYILDRGDHLFPIREIKVDQESGKCLAKSVDGWVNVGTIARVL